MVSPLAMGSGLLFLGLSLSGCLWFDGHCGPFYEDATWREPGLYEALGTKPAAVKLVPQGFPFEHANASARWGDEMAVGQVSWTNESASGHHGHPTTVSLTAGESVRGASVAGPHISMSADARVENETWASMLRAFLAATDTTPDDVDAWIAAFLADRAVIGYSYGADRVERPILSSARGIDRVPGLGALADALGTPTFSSGATQHAAMEWAVANGTWRYRVELPAYHFDLGELRGEAVPVTVDTAGTVTANVPQEVGEDLDGYRDWVATRFQEESLPPPTFTDFDVAIAIC